MVVIGLTGASGSGKSFIAKRFQAYEIPIINADCIVHSIYRTENECTILLKHHFGDRIIRPDHSVNRQELGKIVFNDKEKLKLLNDIVHPFVIREIRINIEEHRKHAKAVLIDAPQLFEAGLEKDCDYVIAVIADDATRIQRIAIRDHISEDVARQRLLNQFSDEYFKERSDFYICNSLHDNIDEQISSILTTIGYL